MGNWVLVENGGSKIKRFGSRTALSEVVSVPIIALCHFVLRLIGRGDWIPAKESRR